METLRIGVIGAGHMGKNHIRNLSDEKRFELVGIYDKDQKQAEKLAKNYTTSVYTEMEKLLEHVDAVVVAVPSSVHKDVSLKAAEYGVHALIEKPLSLNSEDAIEITKVFKDKNLKLAVGHIERFNPVMIELEKLLDSHEIFYIETHRYSPFSGSGRITDTSVIEDLMIHDIDLVCHLLAPNKVLSVSGMGESVRSGNIDFATSILRFSGNAHAGINASRVSQNKERSISIHTADRFIYADLLSRSLTISRNTDVVINGMHDDSYRQDGIVQKIFVPGQEPLRAELISFYDAVVNNADVEVDGQTGAAAIKICEEVVKQTRLVG